MRKAKAEKAARNGKVQWSMYVSKKMDEIMDNYLMLHPEMKKAGILREALKEYFNTRSPPHAEALKEVPK